MLLKINTKLEEVQRLIMGQHETATDDVRQRKNRHAALSVDPQKVRGEREALGSTDDREHAECQERMIQTMLAAVTQYAVQSTIAASTVFYNIATFETDIVNAWEGWGKPIDSNDTAFGPQYTFLFLAANLLTFCAGVVALFLTILLQASIVNAKVPNLSPRVCNGFLRTSIFST